MSIHTIPAPAPDPEIPAMPRATRLVTLDNGLTIILREDHSAPVVSAQAWCKAGSVDEGHLLGAGLSHVLEHMLFKGTASRPPGRIDQEVQSAGGYMNAYTSFDRTVYYINVPNTGARVAVDILCDILCHATLPEEELEKEKQVILREMDMNLDDPGRRSSRRLFETAYTRSPYRFTVIGYPDIFNEVRREDLVSYYRQKYAPNNVFFVIAGDIDPGAVERQIRDAFATVKSRPLPPAVLPEEPRQAGQREVVEEAPIELGHLHIAWHIPDLRHPDVPALDVLSTLLGTGHSSRLYQELRERQGVVHSVDAWTYNPGNPGLFGASAVVDGNRYEAARDAILAQIERMKREPVSPAELTKAVKQSTSATLAARKTMQGQAQDLGANWMAAGDLNFSERYLAAVRRLTPDDLLRVARHYLTTENRTAFALLPEGSARRPVETAAGALDQPIELITLPNGLRLLLKEDHRLPFVEMRAVFRGGVLLESESINGCSLLMTRTLLKGTRHRTASEIATEVESVGGSIDSYAGNNSIGLSLEILSSDFDAGLDLFADLILNPAFPDSAMERERDVQMAGIRAQRDHLLQSAILQMRRSLFGNTSYGLDVHGTEESLTRMRREDLLALYGQLVVPQNAVLAIFGDISTTAVRQQVGAAFGGWTSPVAPPPPAVPPPPPQEKRRVSAIRDKKQAVLVVGFPGVTLNDPHRWALELIQEALSDLGSRLFLRIREQLGLAYYVGAQNFTGLQPGCFSFYAGTAPEKARLVEDELFREAEALRREGLSPAELSRAKAKLIGQRKIARQDLGHLAMSTALDELYGLGFRNQDSDDERYEAVTVEQTREAAIRFLRPESCVVSCVGPDTVSIS